MKGAVVAETPVIITVNNTPVLHATCTPEQLEAFAVGRLMAEGYISDASDVRSVLVSGNENAPTIAVELPLPAAQAGEAERRHRHQQHCGILHFLDCAPDILRRPWLSDAPPLDTFPHVYQQLFAAAEQHKDTGGMHSAALSNGQNCVHVAHDVGRHNAVDKTIGLAVLADEDITRYGLVLTSRISGDIALKAARARLAWVASRSIPTSLALRIAQAAGLPLIGRAPGKDAFVHMPVPPSVA